MGKDICCGCHLRGLASQEASGSELSSPHMHLNKIAIIQSYWQHVYNVCIYGAKCHDTHAFIENLSTDLMNKARYSDSKHDRYLYGYSIRACIINIHIRRSYRLN